MKKTIQLVFILLFLNQITINLNAQNIANSDVYTLKLIKEIPLLSIGIGGGLYGQYLHRQKPVLDAVDIQSLNANAIKPAFDRFATRNNSYRSKVWSDVLLYSVMAAPFSLLLDKNIRNDYKNVGVIGLETYLLNAAVTGITKEIFQRKRPYVYNSTFTLAEKMERDATSSFFSGHTSMVAASYFMTAKMYSDYHPNSKALPFVWAGAATIPALTALFRVKAGKHFLTDVLVGYIVGAGIGLLVPELHRN